MSLDGTFITNPKKTFLQGLALVVVGVVAAPIGVFLTGRLEVLAVGFLVAWGLYLMLRAAKAGRNVGEVEGQACVVCTQLIPSVMVGKFCEKCGQPVHSDCAIRHAVAAH